METFQGLCWFKRSCFFLVVLFCGVPASDCSLASGTMMRIFTSRKFSLGWSQEISSQQMCFSVPLLTTSPCRSVLVMVRKLFRNVMQSFDPFPFSQTPSPSTERCSLPVWSKMTEKAKWIEHPLSWQLNQA